MELSIGFYVLPALPMVVLFAVWPWLWREPFGQLLVTLKHWDYPIREWFLGRLCQPPVYYFPVYFAVTTPVLLLVPFGAFFHMAWRRRSFVDLLILLWFLTPFLWTASVLKQDGVRYIYNMYPPMALMVAIGLDHMLRAVGALRKVAAVGVAAAYLGIQCWLVHPYYLDYYNEAVGGTKGVWERSWFEVGWWGEGQKPCFDHINANAEEGATFDTIGVVNHTVDALRPDLVYSTKDPDWLIRDYQTPAEVEQADYVEVFRVEVDAAPLAIVYLRKEMAGRAAKERRRGPVEPGQWWEAGP